MEQGSLRTSGRRVGLFLLLTFALTWGLDFAIARTIGHGAFLALGIAPLSMFLPAAVALVLQMFFWRDSPIHVRRCRERAILIPVSYLVLTVLYALVTILALALPAHAAALSGLASLLTTLWTLSLFALHGQVGGEGFRRAGLPLGRIDRGNRVALGTVAFLLAQSALNLLFRLGRFQGVREQVYNLPIPRVLYPLALVIAFGLAVTGTPLAGLAATFGEEYAWRGFLFGALAPDGRGRRRAALLVGLIWGVWHVPVILGGIHTYPPTALGFSLALVFFTLWGAVQGYALLRTGSVWVAAFLHGLVNSVYAFGLTYLVRPADKVWSFGLGVYGLLCLLPIVAWILRDRVWDGSLESPVVDTTG